MERPRVKKILPIHYKAMELRLKGYAIDKVAFDLNKSIDTIKSWYYHSDLWRAEWAIIKEEQNERARSILSGAAPKAAATLEEALDGKTNPSAITAAKHILDANGVSPKQQIELNGKMESSHTFDEKLLDNPKFLDLLTEMYTIQRGEESDE